MFIYRDSKPQTESIYDFHDDTEFPDSDDDNCLTIDESPKKRMLSRGPPTVEQIPGSQKTLWAQTNHSTLHISKFYLHTY